MRMPESLKTDTDFERLSPLFSQDYLDHLEESIKAHGCLDPIDIWDGIILNGYKRYRICLKLKIEMPINEKVFACKEDAITWLCYEHLKSASVTQETGVYLIGKHYLAQRQKYFHEQPPSFTKRSTFVYSTAEEVSKIYHLSSGTVYKYGIYAENLDSIYDRDRQLAEYVLSGKLKVSHKTIQLMTTVQDEVLSLLDSMVNKGKVEHITNNELQKMMLKNKVITKTGNRKSQVSAQPNIAIKQTPVYDPDSEISGLYLTIPSWITSIKRSCAKADFSKISPEAKARLQEQLGELEEEIIAAILQITEES